MMTPSAQDEPDVFAIGLALFGGRLADLRRRAGWNQAELGAKIGCSVETVGRYERGESFPPAKVLLRIRKELRVSLDFLVVGMSVGTLRDARLLRLLQELDALPAERVAQLIRVLDLFLHPPAAEAGPHPRPGR